MFSWTIDVQFWSSAMNDLPVAASGEIGILRAAHVPSGFCTLKTLANPPFPRYSEAMYRSVISGGRLFGVTGCGIDDGIGEPDESFRGATESQHDVVCL